MLRRPSKPAARIQSTPLAHPTVLRARARASPAASLAANATEIREYRRLRAEEAILVGNTDIDPDKVQILWEERCFRKLQEGDMVSEGQLLGMVNPSLA